MKRLFFPFLSDNPVKQRGFTLVEMAVVAAIIGFLSTSLIVNFRTRLNLDESVNLVIANIRSAQNNAISSVRYNTYVPCGYGFHYIDPTHFAVYAGPNASTTDCANINRNYQAGEDTLLSSQAFGDARVQFVNVFNDIYFEPPNPKTYLNNNATLSQGPLTIIIGKSGGTVKTVYVYPSGTIEIQ